MLRALRQTGSVDSPVGAYFTSPTGSFFKIALVEALGVYQAVGGRKGIVLLHGASPSHDSPRPRGCRSDACSSAPVPLSPDPSKSAQGSVSIRAFRFSAAFGDALARGASLDTQTLVDHRLTFANLLEELPLAITNSALVAAFLSTIALPTATSSGSTSGSTLDELSAPLLPAAHLPPLALHFPASLTTSLERTTRALDDYQREANALSFNARDIARHQARVDGLVAGGVSEEDAKRQVKVPKETARTQSLMLLRQVEECAKGMSSEAGSGVAKMYAVAK